MEYIRSFGSLPPKFQIKDLKVLIFRHKTNDLDWLFKFKQIRIKLNLNNFEKSK